MKKLADSSFPILYLDTRERERVTVTLVWAKSVNKLQRDERAQATPALVQQLLEREGVALTDVKAIAVQVVPGSLTGVRIGVAVANTLAALQDRPLIEVTKIDRAASLAQIRAAKPESHRPARVTNEVVY